MKILKAFKKNERGFTLIELIVVIAILAILAAIAIPRLAGFTDNAKKSAVEADAKTIATAISALYSDDDSLTTANPPTTTQIKDLAGPYTGTVSSLTIVGGSIGFTYTDVTGTYAVDCVDGVIGDAY